MKKILICISLASALALSACSSLPDGSKKPELTINSVQVAENNGKTGFNVSYTLRHSSLSPLKIRKVTTRVSVNNIPMASGVDENEPLVVPRSDVQLTEFIPANLARPVSLQTIRSPMINARTQAELKVYFVRDEESPFNPIANFSGKLTDEQQ